MECCFVRSDGAELPVEIQLSKIRFAGKSATIGTSRDTSERKRAEQEKQKLEEQLLQAQKLESIGRLAGGVAHDFNNLLTVINGYSTLLLNGPNVTASGRGQLEQIKKAGDRAADLTRQLLAFGRKQAVRPEPLDLNVEVRDLQAMIERLINEDIKLVTNLAPDLGHVWADPAHVQQVLVNLVVNARDALPKGGEIKIETTSVCLTENFLNGEPGAVPGDYVLLSVTDNGIGIDEDTLQHLFEPFFTTKERGKGTGLGLSTVYGIVRQNGGLVRVESEKGRGTVFKVYLPRAEAAEPALKEELGPQFAAGVETVLVAEDHDDVRSLMRNALEAQGYRVLDAASGREALAMEAGHAGPIHLLLTDVIMPGMNGPDLAQKLMIRRPGIKVLYVSGYTDNKIAPQEELGPAAEFLAKPFAPDVVVSRVRKLLGHDVLRG
jgi:signal transduction histidine kinase/CheY-like chemotaxis protein